MEEKLKIKTKVLENHDLRLIKKPSKIHTGGNTRVFRVECEGLGTQKAPKTYIIKQFILRELNSGDKEKTLKIAEREYRLTASAHKRNPKGIIEPYANELSEDENYYEILMEDGGSSIYMEIEGIKNDLDLFMNVMLQCAVILKSLHIAGIYQGDIKTKNFCIDHLRRVKLIDFGVSMNPLDTISNKDLGLINEQKQIQILGGTRPYLSPELLYERYHTHSIYNKKSDIFALGITFLEIMKCMTSDQLQLSMRVRSPVHGEDNKEFALRHHSWLKSEIDALEIGDQLLQSKFQLIFQHMLDFVPEKRPTAKTLAYLLQRLQKLDIGILAQKFEKDLLIDSPVHNSITQKTKQEERKQVQITPCLVDQNKENKIVNHTPKAAKFEIPLTIEYDINATRCAYCKVQDASIDIKYNNCGHPICEICLYMHIPVVNSRKQPHICFVCNYPMEPQILEDIQNKFNFPPTPIQTDLNFVPNAEICCFCHKKALLPKSILLFCMHYMCQTCALKIKKHKEKNQEGVIICGNNECKEIIHPRLIFGIQNIGDNSTCTIV